MSNTKTNIITASLTNDSAEVFVKKLGLSDQEFGLFTSGMLSCLASFCGEFRDSMNQWKFALVELSNGSFYTELFPPQDVCCEGKIRFTNNMNYFNKEVSLPTAGVIATIYGLSFLMERISTDRALSLYQKVIDYGYQLKESDLVMAAID